MIEVSHLTKQYGNHTAVSDLSFKIPKGQIYGLLGPNGAGKSTTMNIMTGCLAATSGDVKIGGYDIFEEPNKAKRLIGYLPEIPPLYLDCTPKEYLRFVARAKNVPEKEMSDQIWDAMERTAILDVADRLIKNLSKGYKQRVGIAQALLGNPEVIILDEPTVGLDPQQIVEIRDLIKQLGETHTVILSSHILSEVQAVCDTVMIISKGHLVACDTPENLSKMSEGGVTVNMTVAADEDKARELLNTIEEVTAVTASKNEEDKLELRVTTSAEDGDALCEKIFYAFSQSNTPVLQMAVEKVNLEDVFIELTGDEEAAPAAEEAETEQETEPEPETESETETEETEPSEESESAPVAEEMEEKEDNE